MSLTIETPTCDRRAHNADTTDVRRVSHCRLYVDCGRALTTEYETTATHLHRTRPCAKPRGGPAD